MLRIFSVLFVLLFASQSQAFWVQADKPEKYKVPTCGAKKYDAIPVQINGQTPYNMKDLKGGTILYYKQSDYMVRLTKGGRTEAFHHENKWSVADGSKSKWVCFDIVRSSADFKTDATTIASLIVHKTDGIVQVDRRNFSFEYWPDNSRGYYWLNLINQPLARTSTAATIDEVLAGWQESAFYMLSATEAELRLKRKGKLGNDTTVEERLAIKFEIK